MSTESKPFITYLGGQILNISTEVNVKKFEVLNNIVYIKTINNGTWELYNFTSGIPLTDEDIFLPGPYQYSIFLRHIKNKTLLLSLNYRIIEYFFKISITPNIYFDLKKISINIDQLIKDLTNDSNPNYEITYVSADYPSEGDTLKTASFYGDNLAKSTFFRNNIGLFVFYRCGLKEKKMEGEVKISNDGAIGMNFKNERMLTKIDSIIKYLIENNYFIEV
jgi:hypothetical protein